MSYLTEVRCLHCAAVQKGKCIITYKVSLAVKWIDVKNAYGFMPHKL